MRMRTPPVAVDGAGRALGRLRTSCASFVLGLALAWALPAAGEGLLRPVSEGVSAATWAELEADPHVVRWRVAGMDREAVFGTLPGDEPLAMWLFGDVEVRARVESARTLEGGSRFLAGALEGGGHFTLFRHSTGVVRGEFHSAKGVFAVRSRGAGSVLVTQREVSALPLCGNGRLSGGPAGAFPALVGRRPQAETPDETVDILVVYTADAETSEGGEDEIKATIEAEIEKTNQAFINSGLSHRQIKLAAMEKVEYTHSTDRIGDDLYYLYAQKGDSHDPEGLLDEVHDLRKKYAADLVHLIVAQPVGTCGAASTYDLDDQRNVQNFCADKPDVDACILQRRKNLFQRRTFSVSTITEGCAVQYTLTHELGHNFGMYHDRYSYNNGLSLTDPENFPLTPYGFGYVNQNFSRSECHYTVMAYRRQCVDEDSISTNRELMFSNPDLQLGSEEVGYDPAGVPGEEWTIDLDGPVNASRAIDEVWDIIANLFHSSTACSEMLLSSVPDTIRTSASGDTRRYLLSSSEIDADYCFGGNLELAAGSDDSFITTSVEARTVVDSEGSESYEYDLAITIAANDGCNSRKGAVSVNVDGVSKDIAIRQRGKLPKRPMFAPAQC